MTYKLNPHDVALWQVNQAPFHQKMAVKVEAFRALMEAVVHLGTPLEAAAEAVGGPTCLYQAAPLQKE